MKKKIETNKAPAAIGPYSQAIEAGEFIYISGQLPINVETGEMENDIASQTKQSLENLKAILDSVNLNMNNIVKTSVFLNDMKDFSAMNEVYSTFFSAPFPARAAVEVARLPKDALVEIQAVAFKG